MDVSWAEQLHLHTLMAIIDVASESEEARKPAKASNTDMLQAIVD